MSSLKSLTVLLNRGFSEKNLSELLTTCEKLLEERQNTLVVFTLKGLFSDLRDFYVRSPVVAERANVLTAGLKEKVSELLNNVDAVTWASLEGLVLLYQSNKVKLKSHAGKLG